jgi:hypothetical protein
MATIVGDKGSVTGNTGFDAIKVNSWSADIDFGEFDNSGFGDLGYTDAIGTLINMKGSFSGILLDSGSPVLSTVLGSPAAVGGCEVTLVLTAATGKTFTCSALITRVGIGTPYAQGQVGSISYNFTSKGRITQAW